MKLQVVPSSRPLVGLRAKITFTRPSILVTYLISTIAHTHTHTHTVLTHSYLDLSTCTVNSTLRYKCFTDKHTSTVLQPLSYFTYYTSIDITATPSDPLIDLWVQTELELKNIKVHF